jgi:hypothetical protein
MAKARSVKAKNIFPDENPVSMLRGYHLQIGGLPRSAEVVVDVIYSTKTIRYAPGLSDKGNLDLKVPIAEEGEALFRVLDVTDPEDPQLLASGSLA